MATKTFFVKDVEKDLYSIVVYAYIKRLIAMISKSNVHIVITIQTYCPDFAFTLIENIRNMTRKSFSVKTAIKASFLN